MSVPRPPPASTSREKLPEWTERDEMRLLKAVLAMAEEPVAEFDPTVSPLDRLGFALVDRREASREEILAKVKDLRRSYEERCHRIRAGGGVGAHNSAVFEISNRIWGGFRGKKKGRRGGKKKSKKKNKAKVGEGAESKTIG